MAASSTQRTALAKPGPHVWLVTLDLPSTISSVTTYYISKVGFAARGAGAKQYKPLVLGYSYPRYGVSDSGGNVQGVEMTIDVDDNARWLTAITEGRNADRIEGCAVVVKQADDTLFSAGVLTAQWITIFTGVVAGIDWKGKTATIRCRVNDSVLKHDAPGPIARITNDTWPLADPAAWTMTAPIIYGEHDSAGFTDQGFIPLFSVDRTNYLYMVSLGRCQNVTAVFMDGKALTLTTHYTWGYTNRRGTWYTTVTITATGYSFIYGAAWTGGTTAEKQAIANGARVTADVLGIEDTGYGTGSLLVNPVDQINHYLSNFVFDTTWRRGAWNASHSRIGSNTALRTFCDDRGFRGAVRIDQPASGTSQLAEWLQSFEFVGYWWTDGKLYLTVDDFTQTTDIYTSIPYARQEKLDLSKNEDTLRVGKVTLNSIHDSAGGDYKASVTAQDPDKLTDAAATIDQLWGDSK